MKSPSIHSPGDIAATVQAMAELLWQYDDIDRAVFEPLFSKMLANPDETAGLIRFMNAMVGCQAPVTKDKALNAAIKGDRHDAKR
jgi:hypothetical protein